MDKSFRIHTDIANDTVLNVNMQQEYDFLEVLTMKLRQKDAYKLHSSNYGVIIGRVLANDAFGIPNAKISVFIAKDDTDDVILESLYPYSDVTSTDKEGRRYNLLPDYSDDDCYRIVGTFPNKRLVLDDDITLEIYDKYWKYSTVTNNAGDYMIFGIPSGNQQLHIDIDLSDIGILSQKPRDFEYKGYNLTMFDNPSQFKESTNLDGLAQLISQNKSVFVYPFWGDVNNGIAAITRCDVQIQYKFEPTCVFMGSIVSDNDSNSINHNCIPNKDNGMNDQLIAGEGTIEMIRKTQDGLVEEYQIQGNQLIDSDGVWCYQIPMNLDFIGTDEYGNIVPTDNPSKGIPTRTQVRFRFSKTESGDEGFSRHTAKYLVPMNPIFSEESVETDKGTFDAVRPFIGGSNPGQTIENMYNFGSNTPQSCFRDLYWNNVYSVKNYVPKVQIAPRPTSAYYSALKGSNLATDQNPIPYNKLRVDIPFTYMVVCLLFMILIIIVTIINILLCVVYYIIEGINLIIKGIKGILDIIPGGGWIADILPDLDWLIEKIQCISLESGLADDTTVYYPGCFCHNYKPCPVDIPNCDPESDEESTDELRDKIQQKLAEEFKIIKLDLQQDWINGCLYMPLWYWRKRKKKSFLFGLFTRRAKNDYCSCNDTFADIKVYTSCEIDYLDNNLGVNDDRLDPSEDRWHKNKKEKIRFTRGVIKQVENKDGLNVYYYVPVDATQAEENGDRNQTMVQRTTPFYAVRLYATDIILLGNLNEDNIYGIPQFFKALPSTTANVPPIATLMRIPQDQNEDADIQESDKTSTVNQADDEGDEVIAGMDWWRDDISTEDSPKYRRGLFVDLSCFWAATLPKSCINVERVSEYGVTLDMTHKREFSDGNDLKRGVVELDGFISKWELDDMENRAMFATMNHMGFIPQDYQDSVGSYETQVNDTATNYLIPKFKYIYPVDFDGRMQVVMDRYRNGFIQSLYDSQDSAYITFRLGAERSEKIYENSEGRIRHFYYHEKPDSYKVPLYNNSYYFYFGVNKGSTAIDKFNKMFYAECFKNLKIPFTIGIESRAVPACSSIYQDPTDTCAYIKVILDDIQPPYSYTLYNSFNEIVVQESGMQAERFVIGGEIGENDKVICRDGVYYQLQPNELIDNPEYSSGLKNDEYILDVTNADGKTLTKVITLENEIITANIDVYPLGIKFYSSSITTRDYVCNEDNEYYGRIEITSFIVDGHECKITASTPFHNAGENTFQIIIKGDSNDGVISNATARIVLEPLITYEELASIEDCLCNPWHKFEDNKVIIKVYEPTTFNLTITQLCGAGNVETDNTSSTTVIVNNGENFNAFLNTMPVRFIVNSGNFYTASPPTNIRDEAWGNPNLDYLSGWYGLHEEKTYKFDAVTKANEPVWLDYVNLKLDISEFPSKIDILYEKFKSIFKICSSYYITGQGSTTGREYAEFTAKGGTETLTRTIYYNLDNSNDVTYVYADSGRAPLSKRYPDFVGKNYITVNENGARASSDGLNFNPRFMELGSIIPIRYITHQGTYFAAYTKKGGYKNITEVDCTKAKKAIRIPNKAAVNADNDVKQLGKVTKDNYIEEMPKAFMKGSECGMNTLPQLRTLTIDRRIDFDMEIVSPITNSKTFSFYTDETRENVWRMARISGTTYNGIEMSYEQDEDMKYNIISANVSDNVATPTTRLEYSYSATSSPNDDAVTIYNKATDTVWGKWHNGYDANIDVDSKHIIKEFYESKINKIDVSNLYWSTFNENRLGQFISQQQGGNVISIDKLNTYSVFVFNHSNGSGTYNGEFNREDVKAGNYPTTRILDLLVNPSDRNKFNYTITSCSYKSPTFVKDKLGNITCAINGGEEAYISTTASDPVSFCEKPDPNNPNVVHLRFGRKATNVNTFVLVPSTDNSYLNMSFKYNRRKADNILEVVPMLPYIVKVLPRINNIDGITWLKTASAGAKVSGYNNISNSFYDAIMGGSGHANGIVCPGGGFAGNSDDDYLNIARPHGDIGYNSDECFIWDDELIDITNSDFARIIFHNTMSLPELGVSEDTLKTDGAVFAVMTKKLYTNIDKRDGLTKKALVYEFSEFIDARPVEFSYTNNGNNVTITIKLLTNQAFIDITNYMFTILTGEYNEEAPKYTASATINASKDTITLTATATSGVANISQWVLYAQNVNNNFIYAFNFA